MNHKPSWTTTEAVEESIEVPGELEAVRTAGTGIVAEEGEMPPVGVSCMDVVILYKNQTFAVIPSADLIPSRSDS